MRNSTKRKDIIDVLKDFQAIILDLRDKVEALDVEDTDLELLWENKRLEAYELAETTSAIADDLSYQLSTCEDCLADRIYKKHRFLKDIEEAEEDADNAYEDHPAYLSNAQRGLA